MSILFSLQAVAQPTKQYKGIHFGKLTSQRMDFGGKDGPGPGEYEPYQQVEQVVEHAHLPTADRSKFQAWLPRYNDLIIKNEEKKVMRSSYYIYIGL